MAYCLRLDAAWSFFPAHSGNLGNGIAPVFMLPVCDKTIFATQPLFSVG